MGTGKILLKGKKQEMTQVFTEEGRVVPVTLIKLDEGSDLSGLTEKMEVKVRGVSKGHGFAGVIKRHGFRGGPRTHGQSDRERAPGSVGAGTDPGRIFKGKKMPGRYGGDAVTITGLKIVGINSDLRLVMIGGSVPGARNTQITMSIENGDQDAG